MRGWRSYFPDYGWITFDPTPPATARRGGLLGRLAMYWDWFQFAWGEWIINYDFVHQLSLAQNMQKTSHDFGERAQKYYREKQNQVMQLLLALDRRLEASPYFLPTLLVLLVALLMYLRGRPLISYVVARWSLRARRAGNLTASLAALEYREMLRLLEKRGWKKAESQTPLEFAAAIPASEVVGARGATDRALSIRALRRTRRANRADVFPAARDPRHVALAQILA